MDIKTYLRDLDISERLSNVCKTARIYTLEELCKLDYNTLISFWGLGKKTLEEINALRIRFGFEPLSYKNKIEPSKIIAHRENVFHFIDQLHSIPYNIFIDIRMAEINLTNRLINALKGLGIHKIKDIIQSEITPNKLLSQKNVGQKTVKEYEYFYDILKERITKNKTGLSKKIEGMDLLQNKLLTDIIISFPLYNALSKFGVYKLRDILELEITPQKLYNQIGLKGKPTREFNELLDKLKQEKNHIKLKFPELFGRNDNYFDVSYLSEKFENMPISFFMLPPVVDRFLENNQIQTFKELGSNAENQFIGLTPYIKQTMNSLLQNILEGNFNGDFVPRESHYFPCWVDNFIENLSVRDSEIFKLRYACYEKLYTLEEIGKKMDITRERARQITNSFVKNFRRKFSLALKSLESEFKEKIINKFSPLTEEVIFQKMDVEGLVIPKYPRQMYLHFLQEIFSPLLIEYKGKLLKTKYSSFEERVETRIIKLLKERLPIAISKEKFRQFVQDNSRIDIFSFVRVALTSKRINIINEDGKVKLALKRSTFDNGVRAIFNSIEKPITLSEFKKKLHFYFPNLKNFFDEDYIRARLVSHPLVYRMDTDLFGNVKHLDTLCPGKERIVELCFREFENRKIPTAIYDLVPLISFSNLRFNPQNPNFLLDAIISTDKRFVKLGRLLYGLKKWGKIELINIADQAYEILKKSKVPMHFNELFNILQQGRSVHEISLSTILRVDERFHHYPPGWYGLSESHEDNLIYLLLHRPYIDSLIYSQQPGASIEEIVDVLDMQDYFDNAELENILLKDQRFIIYNHEGKKKIYHKNWSPRKLITTVLRDHTIGMNLQELQWKLNDLYGFARKFSLRDIRNAISTMVNILKIEDRYVLAKEVKVSDNLIKKIKKFVEINMADKTLLYNLEEMYDLFKDISEIDDDEVTFHHFKIGFEKQFKENFIQIGSDIYRRKN